MSFAENLVVIRKTNNFIFNETYILIPRNTCFDHYGLHFRRVYTRRARFQDVHATLPDVHPPGRDFYRRFHDHAERKSSPTLTRSTGVKEEVTFIAQKAFFWCCTTVHGRCFSRRGDSEHLLKVCPKQRLCPQRLFLGTDFLQFSTYR